MTINVFSCFFHPGGPMFCVLETPSPQAMAPSQAWRNWQEIQGVASWFHLIFDCWLGLQRCCCGHSLALSIYYLGACTETPRVEPILNPAEMESGATWHQIKIKDSWTACQLQSLPIERPGYWFITYYYDMCCTSCWVRTVLQCPESTCRMPAVMRCFLLYFQYRLLHPFGARGIKTARSQRRASAALKLKKMVQPLCIKTKPQAHVLRILSTRSFTTSERFWDVLGREAKTPAVKRLR